VKINLSLHLEWVYALETFIILIDACYLLYSLVDFIAKYCEIFIAGS
jgi:hypothetical protein